MNINVKMRELDKTVTHPKLISNEYAVSPRNDSVYETIDDHDPYVSTQDNNDDYLIPSKPMFSYPSSETINNATYMEMGENKNVYHFEPTLPAIQSDSFYSPPLPTRNIKRKKSFITLCK